MESDQQHVGDMVLIKCFSQHSMEVGTSVSVSLSLLEKAQLKTALTAHSNSSNSSSHSQRAFFLSFIYGYSLPVCHPGRRKASALVDRLTVQHH